MVSFHYRQVHNITKKSIYFYSFSEGCTIENFAFGSGDILVSGEYNLHDSATDCQQACQLITECQYWTYYDDTVTDKPNYCELKHSDDEDADYEMEGAISGPKVCPSDQSMFFFLSLQYGERKINVNLF